MSSQKLYQRMMRTVRAGTAPRTRLDLTGASAATPEAKTLLQRGAKTRVILHLLREKGRLTRQQIYEMTPRDLVSSKNQITKLLQILARQKRIKAFVPKGWIVGKDPYCYKLNPSAVSVNFPELFGKTAQARKLQQALYGEEKPFIPHFERNNPSQPPSKLAATAAAEVAANAQ
eukprot:TRINITY_DN11225_c0_g1_i1.p1 TRINITY_DN11225_c0_g1~~TRINITY_DN11225_c0_g1_i1.p1  ORF type:complete len:186 (+),score=52.04 TRINITY_DN11225_c0_g1_i1:37-558(+)